MTTDNVSVNPVLAAQRADPKSLISLAHKHGYKSEYDKMVSWQGRKAKANDRFLRSLNSEVFSKTRKSVEKFFCVRVTDFYFNKYIRAYNELMTKPELVEEWRNEYEVFPFCGCEEHDTGNWNIRFLFTVHFGSERKPEDEYIIRIDPATRKVVGVIGNWDTEANAERLAKRVQIVSDVNESLDVIERRDDEDKTPFQWRQAEFPKGWFIEKWAAALDMPFGSARDKQFEILREQDGFQSSDPDE